MNTHPVSNCCLAGIHTEGSDDFGPGTQVTMYYVCDKCHKACEPLYDLKTYHETIAQTNLNDLPEQDQISIIQGAGKIAKKLQDEVIAKGTNEEKKNVTDQVEELVTIWRDNGFGGNGLKNCIANLIRAVGEELIESIKYEDLNPYKVKEIKEDLEDKLEAIISSIQK